MSRTIIVLVTLPSGNQALYDVQPHNLPREGVPESFLWPVEHGTQVAHEKDGTWYQPGGWRPMSLQAAAAIRLSFPGARVASGASQHPPTTNQ